MISVIRRAQESISHFTGHWFVRNTALLQLGTFGGTFIQAISGVILARLLQPELFGVYTLAFGVASVASILLGGGVQDAISAIVGETYARQDVARTREGFAFLIKISLCAAVVALVISVWAPVITEQLYGNRAIGWYALIVIAAAALSTLFFSVVSLGLQIAGEIKKLSLFILIDQFLRFGLSLVFVLAGQGVRGAALGHLAGSVLVFFISLRLWSALRRQHPVFPNFSELAQEIRRVPLTKYLGFSFWITVDRNIATLYSSLPVLLTGIFVAAREVTFFKLAFGYLNVALSLLGPVSVLLNVEFPRMKVIDPTQLGRNFRRASFYGLSLSVALTTGAIIISPVAFNILYGASFQASVPYVFGLFMYGALFGIGVALGPMWRAIHRVKVSIVINLITLGVGIPLALWLIGRYGLWGSVTAVTVWFTASHVVSYFYLRRALNRLSRG